MAEIPEHGNRRKALIPFMPYLQSECARGNRNANALFRVISAQGYRGSYMHVVEFVRDVRAKWITATTVPILCQTADTSSIKLKMPVAPKPFAQWLADQTQHVWPRQDRSPAKAHAVSRPTGVRLHRMCGRPESPFLCAANPNK
jgi:hypothetical protein